MNTTIGKSFGLALLMAMGVVLTMLALGMFSVKPAGAAPAGAGLGTITAQVVPNPTKARSIAQYTILVTGATSDSGMSAIPVGGTITLTFQSTTTVPSSIAASAVKLKASLVQSGSDGDPGDPDQLVEASAVTVSGRAITITIPDMVTGTAQGNIGDNGIAADGGVTITLTQSAGIQNPNTAGDSFEIGVTTSEDTVSVNTLSYSITSFVSFSPTSGARGDTITVTGGGFAKNCTDCKIRFNPQNDNSVTAPVTGAGSTTAGSSNGSGSIDANGVFEGTVVLTSSTAVGGYVWVTDSTGIAQVSSSTFTQKAGATPRSTTATAGGTVTVDLVDFNTPTATVIADGSTTVGISTNFAANSTSGPFVINEDDDSGDTLALTPYKFVVPIGTAVGTHLVTIEDSLSELTDKSATFSLEIVARVLTVTPNPAAIGQSITISGTGFKKSGTIDSITGSGSADLQAGASISIDSGGAWSFTTTMDTVGSSADRVSDSFTITATDNTSLVGKSSGFKRTARTLTLTPSTGSPGAAITVTVTGMTVDDGENTTTATFTMSAVQSDTTLTLSGTKIFPIGSDGTGSGTITVPLSAAIGTITFKAQDNADALNLLSTVTVGQIAEADLTVSAGTLVLSPLSASTGQLVTITGSNFPPNATATALTFGAASAIPTGGITSDATGGFVIVIEVPAADTGGSISPGSLIVLATLGLIDGSTTSFSIPSPSIVITPASAAPEETIVITGSGFNALTAVTTLDIGTASALPSPAPKAGRSGDIVATIEVPLLNPGVYTVVMKNATGFTATGTFTAVSSKATPAAATDATETIFADVIANDDNLVRVWRFSNADQSWAFYDPRPAFATANTLTKSGAGDIVWVNVIAEQEFQGATLFPGWNLISLK